MLPWLPQASHYTSRLPSTAVKVRASVHGLKPDDMLLFCNTIRINQGHLAAFNGAVQEAVSERAHQGGANVGAGQR